MNRGTVELFSKKKHNRKDFKCGNRQLDDYFKKILRQDVKRRATAGYVLHDAEKKKTKGYYTLSSYSIPKDLIPDSFSKKMPKYDTIPVTLLGRLAIDKHYQGEGIGEFLLIDALNRSLTTSKKVASFAVVVDPIDKGAENFYEKYGFIKLPTSKKMVLPMETIAKAFGS